MFRFLAFALVLTASAVAQANCSTNCPRIEFAPISGRVLNAADGHPIAGAVVHYRGDGGVFDENNREIAPPTLQGEVTTGVDGSYTLPKLPPGRFIVRASAQGFLGEKQYLQPMPVGFKLHPVPLPRDFCMKATGKPVCTSPAMPDGVFHLQADPLELRAMSDEALTRFALPQRGYSARRYLAGAFSPDGDRFSFLTLDSVTLHDVTKVVLPPFRRCAVWNYELGTGSLTAAQDLQPFVCEGSDHRIVWDGDTFYIVYRSGGDVAVSDQVVRVQQREAMMWPVGNLSVTGKEEIARATAERAAQIKSGSLAVTTRDGRFSIDQSDEGQCRSLVITSTESQKERTVASGCPSVDFVLDRERDLLFYNETITAENERNHVGRVTEVDLVTGRSRVFGVPVMNYEPQLFAWQPLPDGATRMAYTIEGDCDFAASDYSQPGQPDGELGNTLNRFSVCFIRIPPSKSKASSTSAQ